MNDTFALSALSEALVEAIARAAPSVVAVDASRRDASGFVWDEHHIVTADHLIDDEDAIDIITAPDTPPRRAAIVGRDEATDLALLRVPDALPRSLARSEAEPQIGSLALAISRDDDGDPAANFGVVSAVAGPWRTWRGGEIERYVRTGIMMNAGYSGGPLVDVAGALIGMNTWGLSRRHALVVPLVTVTRVIAALLSGGHAPHPYLGVSLQGVRLPESLRATHGLPQRSAAIVLDVADGGPADRAGVAIGDVIIALEGRTIEDSEDLQAALAGCTIDSVRALRIIRGGELRTISVAVGNRP